MGTRDRSAQIVHVALLVFAVALAFAAPGRAASPPPPVPPSESAVSQYVETIPSSSGPEAVGAAPSRSTALSQRALDAIVTRGGRDAGLLQMIATSTYYGAPSAPLRARGDGGGGAGFDAGPAELWVILALVTLAVVAVRRRPTGQQSA